LSTEAPTTFTENVLITATFHAPNGSTDAIPPFTQVAGQNVSAALEIQSTDGALLLPRLTTAQMEALLPYVGMLIYNLDDDKVYIYDEAWSPIVTEDSGYGPGRPLYLGSDSNSESLVVVNYPLPPTIDSPSIDAPFTTAVGFNALLNGIGIAASGNSAFGSGTLSSLVDGDVNSAFGWDSLQSCVDGDNNSGFGAGSLRECVSGNNNSAFGVESLLNFTGSNACAFGTSALLSLESGNGNLAVGYQAGNLVESATNCAFIGTQANGSVSGLVNATVIGYNTTAVQSNTVILGNGADVGIGTNAPAGKLHVVGSMLLNGSSFTPNVSAALEIQSTTGGFLLPRMTTAQMNLLLPSDGLLIYNTTADEPYVYIGTWQPIQTGAGYGPGDPLYLVDDVVNGNLAVSNPITTFGSGQFNTVVGNLAMVAATSGSSNSAFGWTALETNLTGNRNSAFGAAAMGDAATNTSDNNAFGYQALRNVGGNRNCAFGVEALFSVESGSAVENSAFGHNALRASTTTLNSAFGAFALFNNGTGQTNSAFGRGALALGEAGSSNCGFGFATLFNCNSNSNSGFGTESLGFLESGNGNSAFGSLTGSSVVSATNCTFIGYQANGSASGLENATAIGYNTTAVQNNTVILGNGADVGIGTSEPAAKLHVVGSIQQRGLGSDAAFNSTDILRGQASATTSGAVADTIDFPMVTSVNNTMMVRVDIVMCNTTAAGAASGTSLASAYYESATTTGLDLPAITLITTGIAVTAAWSISGNNIRLTVNGVAANNLTWVVKYELFRTTVNVTG